MDRQENNDDTREVDMDLESSDEDDDWPVFSSMQQWAYTSISFLELYDIGDGGALYETMAGFVALIIILFHATNTIQRENQNNLASNSNDEVSEENK